MYQIYTFQPVHRYCEECGEVLPPITVAHLVVRYPMWNMVKSMASCMRRGVVSSPFMCIRPNSSSQKTSKLVSS